MSDRNDYGSPFPSDWRKVLTLMASCGLMLVGAVAYMDDKSYSYYRQAQQENEQNAKDFNLQLSGIRDSLNTFETSTLSRISVLESGRQTDRQEVQSFEQTTQYNIDGLRKELDTATQQIDQATKGRH